MATNINQIIPAVGDRPLRDWLRGGAFSKAWDFKVMSGCALTGVGTSTLSIANGVVACGGFLVRFNADSYAASEAAVTQHLYFELNEVDNADNQLINYTAAFVLNAADASTADFYFKVAEITTAGAPVLITVIDEGEDDTWYARPRVWILPSMFLSNDPADPAYMSSATNDVIADGAGTELVGNVEIPAGFKATKAMMYDDATNLVVRFYEANIASGNLALKGAGNCNTEINMTDVEADGTAYIVIVIDNINGTKVFNGYLTLELLAS